MPLKEVFKSIFLLPGNKGSRFWALRRALFWHLWKRLVRKPLLIQLANGMYLRAYPECVESSLAFYVRWPDRSEIEWLRAHLRQGEMILDIGANIGVWSLLLADVVGRENILGMEPGRVACARLRENFRLNGISENQVHEVAAGNRPGEVEFPDPARPETGASVLERGSGMPTRQVRQITLDGLIPQIFGKKIGLLKIDVEGFEPEVFEGASEVLSTMRPRIVLFESFEPRHLSRCREVLGKHGYALAGETADPAPPCSPQNHFAFPLKS